MSMLITPMSMLILTTLLLSDVMRISASGLPALRAGNAHCPCLEEADISWEVDIGYNSAKGESCLLARNVKGDLACYNSTYGIGCRKHDLHQDPFCVNREDNEEKFCGQEWCYVDINTCYPNGNISAYASDGLVGNEGKAFYSYETCGYNASLWRNELLKNKLLNKTIRVGVPWSVYPEQFYIHGTAKALSKRELNVLKRDTKFEKNFLKYDHKQIPSNAKRGEMHGLYVDILDELAEIGGFGVEYTRVSSASLEKHDDKYDACTQDVANGVVDLCIGNFWIKEERLGYGAR